MDKCTLDFKCILDKDINNLVSAPTMNCLKKYLTEEELKDVYVACIDEEYIDGIGICEHYNVDTKNGANCLICECKRGDNRKYVALVVPVSYKYNMSTTIRKYTNSRMVSVAPLEKVLEDTKMEYGSINPIGLPDYYDIIIDTKVMDVDRIICGSGLRISKLSLPTAYLRKLPNVYIMDNVAKEI